MTTTSAMIESTPADIGFDREKLAACIDACFECAQTCMACADACLSEDMVAELTKCICIDLDCADQCLATGKVLSRHARLRRQTHASRPRSVRHRVQSLR